MYNSFYIGIVVQNNDPEKRGRVKVFIPSVNSHLVQEWLQKNEKQELEDVDFSFVGIENNPQLQKILPQLKDSLPWAEYAGPIFGGNATGRYNASTQKGYTEDHNQWDGKDPAFIHRPAAEFSNANPPKDGFNNPDDVGQLNPFAYAYDSSNYSTLASGVFSVPNVGAHTWCFFEGGDINCPVYFAATYGKEDISRIYTQEKHTQKSVDAVKGKGNTPSLNSSVDYPATYENIPDDNFGKDAQTFRSKHVINSNKHAIELIDTDNREILKFTHYSGSFKEFTNFANIELATKNDQKLVIGDQFETIQSNKNLKVSEDFRTYVDGDCYERVGTQRLSITQGIKDIITDIHQFFHLFDLRRAKIYDGGDTVEAGGVIKPASGLPNFLSPLQKRQESTKPKKEHSKGFTVCPICQGDNYTFDSIPYLASLQPTPILIHPAKIIGPLLNCATVWPVMIPLTNQPTLNLTTPTPSIADLELLSSLESLQNSGKGYFAGAKCDVCNSDLLLVPDKQPGYSPSSFNGEWETEHRKEPGNELDKKVAAAGPKILELERQMGGGDKIINIGKNKIETVGTVMNDLPSIRVDPVGKLRSENVFVAPESVYISYRPAPHVEPVTTLNVPGGDYIITAMNKFKLLVGANGINIKTFGPMDMYGTLFNVSGQQININAQYEINIDGGDRFSLRGRKISFHPKEHSPVMVDGALHVSRNAIVRGGLHVDGQFATPAIASIREYGETSDGVWSPPGLASEEVAGEAGAVLGANSYSYVACGKTGPVFGNPEGVDVYVLIPPHTHLYERPPSQLFNSIQALRAFMADPSGKPTSAGTSAASINDVQLSSAASPVNNIALGPNAIPVLSYAAIIRKDVIAALESDPAVKQIGSVSISTAEPNEDGSQISGFLNVDIKRTYNGTSVSNKLDTYTYSISYSINVADNQYVNEAAEPIAELISSIGYNGGEAASNPPSINL